MKSKDKIEVVITDGLCPCEVEVRSFEDLWQAKAWTSGRLSTLPKGWSAHMYCPDGSEHIWSWSERRWVRI